MINESFNTVVSKSPEKDEVPATGFELDPIMSIDGALKINARYGDNGVRLSSEDQADPEIDEDTENVYGIGIDYRLKGDQPLFESSAECLEIRSATDSHMADVNVKG